MTPKKKKQPENLTCGRCGERSRRYSALSGLKRHWREAHGITAARLMGYSYGSLKPMEYFPMARVAGGEDQP